MFETKLLFSHTYRDKKELNEWKLKQRAIIIHEEAMYTFLIGPSLALIAQNSPCTKKKVLGFSSGRGRF
jgi:hypothetical protein